MNKQQILPYYFNSINHMGKSVIIKIRTIQHDEPEEELRNFAKTMANIFSCTEPMTIAAGITEEECFEEMYSYLQFAKKDRLSLILTNEETGKIIGGYIGRDFYHAECEDPYENISNREKFNPIFDFVNISKNAFLETLRKEGHTLKPGLVYISAYVGFINRYIILYNNEGFDLPSVSCRIFEEYVKNLGYKYFYGEVTSPGSQKLLKDSGWTIDEIVIPYKNNDLFRKIDFHKHSLQGIGNSLCGAIYRVGKDFPPLKNAIERNKKLKQRNLEVTTV